MLDVVLKKLPPMFDDLCEEDGCPGIPPGQLLMARVITALYSARSLSAGQAGWTRDERFTAGGTIVESRAGLKSFVRKDGADAAKAHIGQMSYRQAARLSYLS